MSHHVLSVDEAGSVTDAFLTSLYGEDVLTRWRVMKESRGFETEREYVLWLMDAAVKLEEFSVYNEKYEGAEMVSEGRCDEEEMVNDGRYGEAEMVSDSVEVDGLLHTTHNDGMFYHKSEEDECVLIEDNETSYNMLSVAATAPVCSNKSASSYLCPHCTSSFSNRHNLSRHVSGVHERHKPYSCPHCEYKSSQKPQLKQHLIYRHGYSSDHRCEVCGKSFPVPSHLETHRMNCLRDCSSK